MRAHVRVAASKPSECLSAPHSARQKLQRVQVQVHSRPLKMQEQAMEAARMAQDVPPHLATAEHPPMPVPRLCKPQQEQLLDRATPLPPLHSGLAAMSGSVLGAVLTLSTQLAPQSQVAALCAVASIKPKPGGVIASSEWWESYEVATLPRLHTFSPSQLASLLSAAACARMPCTTPFLTALVESLKNCPMRGCGTAATAAAAVHAMDSLKAFPCALTQQEWVPELLPLVVQGVPYLCHHDLATLTTTLPTLSPDSLEAAEAITTTAYTTTNCISNNNNNNISTGTSLSQHITTSICQAAASQSWKSHIDAHMDLLCGLCSMCAQPGATELPHGWLEAQLQQVNPDNLGSLPSPRLLQLLTALAAQVRIPGHVADAPSPRCGMAAASATVAAEAEVPPTNSPIATTFARSSGVAGWIDSCVVPVVQRKACLMTAYEAASCVRLLCALGASSVSADSQPELWVVALEGVMEAQLARTSITQIANIVLTLAGAVGAAAAGGVQGACAPVHRMVLLCMQRMEAAALSEPLPPYDLCAVLCTLEAAAQASHAELSVPPSLMTALLSQNMEALGSCPAFGLVDILSTVSALGHTPCSQWMHAFCTALQPRLGSLGAAHVACVVTTLQALCVRAPTFTPPSPFLSDLFAASTHTLKHLPIAHAVEVAGAFGRLSPSGPSWGWAQEFEWATSESLGSLELQQQAALIKALQQLGYRPSHRWQACFMAAVHARLFSPNQLQHIPSTAVTQVAPRPITGCDGVTGLHSQADSRRWSEAGVKMGAAGIPAALASVMTGLTYMCAQPSPELQSDLLYAVRCHMSVMSAHHLLAVLRFCAATSLNPGCEWWSDFLDATASKMKTMDNADLCSLITLTLTLKVKPSHAWLSDWAAATLDRVPTFTSEQLHGAITCMAACGHTPSPAWLSKVEGCMERHAGCMAPTALVKTVAILDRMGCTMEDEVLHALFSRTPTVLAALDPPACAQLVWAIHGASVAPQEAWVRALLNAVQSHLPRFKRRHLESLVSGLRAMLSSFSLPATCSLMPTSVTLGVAFSPMPLVGGAPLALPGSVLELGAEAGAGEAQCTSERLQGCVQEGLQGCVQDSSPGHPLWVPGVRVRVDLKQAITHFITVAGEWLV